MTFWDDLKSRLKTAGRSSINLLDLLMAAKSDNMGRQRGRQKRRSSGRVRSFNCPGPALAGHPVPGPGCLSEMRAKRREARALQRHFGAGKAVAR